MATNDREIGNDITASKEPYKGALLNTQYPEELRTLNDIQYSQ